jgi:hypothetical protein
MGKAQREAYDNCENKALKGTLSSDTFIYFAGIMIIILLRIVELGGQVMRC